MLFPVHDCILTLNVASNLDMTRCRPRFKLSAIAASRAKDKAIRDAAPFRKPLTLYGLPRLYWCDGSFCNLGSRRAQSMEMVHIFLVDFDTVYQNLKKKGLISSNL